MGFYSAKRNDMVIYCTMFEPKNIILNEKNETQKTTCCMILFI